MGKVGQLAVDQHPQIHQLGGRYVDADIFDSSHQCVSKYKLFTCMTNQTTKYFCWPAERHSFCLPAGRSALW